MSVQQVKDEAARIISTFNPDDVFYYENVQDTIKWMKQLIKLIQPNL